MWLTSSSVGRKFIMAITGACLVLFVTFHCLMNAIAICWPTAYNSVCMFLGANWYALIASAGLGLLIVLHIIYALILTIQNRKARGSQRYSQSHRPKNVEWSSQNMFVLGIVILAFLVVHLIQFWAKMQLKEIIGGEMVIPPTAGTLFIQEAFSCWITPVVYIIGFIALWFHMNHGFWSMFQSVGWDNTTWIPRLRTISNWWVSIVIALFVCQAVVFTVQSNNNYYKTNEELRAQYLTMLEPMLEEDFGPDAATITQQISTMPFDQLKTALRQQVDQLKMQLDQVNSPEMQQMLQGNPEMATQLEKMKGAYNGFSTLQKFIDFLDSTEPAVPAAEADPRNAAPQHAAPAAAAPQVEEAPAQDAENPADNTPAQENNSNN